MAIMNYPWRWLGRFIPCLDEVFYHVRQERFRSLGKNVFGKENGMKAIEDFLDSVGMRLRLRDLGCKLEEAQNIAELALRSSPQLTAHPTPLDLNTIIKIYCDSF